MSQAKTLPRTGRETGSTTYCTICGGHLRCIDGTDPDNTDELGGFEETYECESCERTGMFVYRYESGARSYSGICAGEHMWQ